MTSSFHALLCFSTKEKDLISKFKYIQSKSVCGIVSKDRREGSR